MRVSTYVYVAILQRHTINLAVFVVNFMSEANGPYSRIVKTQQNTEHLLYFSADMYAAPHEAITGGYSYAHGS